jgi:membrane-bound lytic murein transglycosylase B
MQMPAPDESSSPASRSVHAWLATAVIVAFTALGCWLVVGALTTSEPRPFHVAPQADIAPALAAGIAPASGIAGTSSDLSAADPTPAPAAVTAGNAERVDSAWAERTAAATGIPVRALRAYAGAELAVASEAPACGLRWSTLAALGFIESGHGTHAGSEVGDDGVTRPGIFGIDLTGASSARITDTDGGVWDGKADIDRAVGPMQFIPATWETWGADGNGDGVRDPQQIDDAALAAARYLCHDSDLTEPAGWRRAIFSYNHLDSYVDAVAQAANDYANRVGR